MVSTSASKTVQQSFVGTTFRLFLSVLDFAGVLQGTLYGFDMPANDTCAHEEITIPCARCCPVACEVAWTAWTACYDDVRPGAVAGALLPREPQINTCQPWVFCISWCADLEFCAQGPRSGTAPAPSAATPRAAAMQAAPRPSRLSAVPSGARLPMSARCHGACAAPWRA